MPTVHIEDIAVYHDSLRARIRCDKGYGYVSEKAATSMKTLLPRLEEQICVNSRHRYFGPEMVGTETPHLIEHVTIELMVSEARLFDEDVERTYMGTTSWSHAEDDGETAAAGAEEAMEVCITFDNDLVALAALKHAAELVEWAFAGGIPSPDVRPILQELHGLRMD